MERLPKRKEQVGAGYKKDLENKTRTDLLLMLQAIDEKMYQKAISEEWSVGKIKDNLTGIAVKHLS